MARHAGALGLEPPTGPLPGAARRPRAARAKALIGEASRRAWGSKRRADGYDRGTGADPDSPKARAGRALQAYVDDFEAIPVVILVGAVPWRVTDVTAGASIYPACQNLLLAARALGYGGTMMMWHGLVEADLRSLLAIPDEILLAATITLGVPEGRHGPLRRRPLPEVVYDDTWGAPATWAVDPPDTRFTSAGPRGAER
ncbi:MAG TPA: nitroreductase family protein [Acidimicrobiales bacterium]|nr:nitroreductase family protein [Acidimicrobiales bacterium]